jgi:quinoprotein dehydrogenase-associated probable ABC transporter substrate-binding protein
MRQHFSLCAIGIFCAAVPATQAAEPTPKPVLAVCADPSNLPYSNDKLEGFENRIAAVLAADMHAQLRYTWNEERRSFLRRTLFAGRCDVVISLPTALSSVTTTRPYFVSSYVAVTRRKDARHFAGFADPALRNARIGLQLLGAEGANTPPAMELGRSGFTAHITGFPMWADDDVANPQGRIVDAVATNDIDVAYVWGPFGYYFAKPHGATLLVEPIGADPKWPELAFSYPMGAGVRKDDLALRDRLQTALDRRKSEIYAILQQYGMPIQAPLTR